MQDIILAFITAFSMTYFVIPSVIKIANEKHLVDEPGERRSHKLITPSLGGGRHICWTGFCFGVVARFWQSKWDSISHLRLINSFPDWFTRRYHSAQSKSEVFSSNLSCLYISI